jgi:hypothetical protein
MQGKLYFTIHIFFGGVSFAFSQLYFSKFIKILLNYISLKIDGLNFFDAS